MVGARHHSDAQELYRWCTWRVVGTRGPKQLSLLEGVTKLEGMTKLASGMARWCWEGLRDQIGV